MIEAKGLKKTYRTGGLEQKALDDVSITFRDHEFVAILGPSGSGKTTLLNILGGLDHPDEGELVINGISTKDYRGSDWETYRNHYIGFIFQSYNLIPHQTILSNVELALTLSGVGRKERQERSLDALGLVGLREQAHKYPRQLSGGQMQRVAIARALVNDPDIVLADEPTGALDSETGLQVMDILKDISKDRLVIMVTHNGELADEYATRIIRLHDGRIEGDTMPVAAAAAGQAAAVTAAAGITGTAEASEKASQKTSQEASEIAESNDAEGGEAHGTFVRSGPARRKKRASMGFFTALSLSFSNLMSKKGRTFLTAFAGSIGIIGIAAILALSTGVNNYIQKVEEDTLSSYPITISRNAANLETLFMAGNVTSEGETSQAESEAAIEAETVSLDDIIPENRMFSDTLDNIHTNDLVSFKEYLEEHFDEIENNTNAVVYYYGITPLIYSGNIPDVTVSDSEDYESSSPGRSHVLLNGTDATSYFSSLTSSLGVSATGSGSFQEMLGNDELLQSQFDVIAGRWPENENEGLLVLSSGGSISDYTLFQIGILDKSQYEAALEALSDAEEVQTGSTEVELTYRDALELTYLFVPPAFTYSHNTETDTWSDRSADSAYMEDVLDEAIPLHIVGVIRPNSTSDAVSLTQGIAYTPELTQAVIEAAEGSEIVQAQLADPDTDIFTGRTFEELQDEASEGFDLSEIFNVDEDAVEDIFSFDESAFDSIDLSGINVSSMGDLSSALSSVDSQAIVGTLLNGIGDDIAALPDYLEANGISLTEDERNMINSAMRQMMAELIAGYTVYQEQVMTETAAAAAEAAAAGEEAPAAPEPSEIMQAYLAEESTRAVISRYAQALQEDLEEEGLQEEITNAIAAYMAGVMSERMQTAMEQLMAGIGAVLQQQIQSVMSQAMSQLSSQLASSMENAFSFDPTGLSEMFTLNMTQDELTSLLTDYMHASDLSYEKNLSTLGYADRANPVSISLYPVNFEAKYEIQDFIYAYNDAAEAAGESERTIAWTDLVGTILSSVTRIVNMISLVLIAFVSISLVVSSIMIGIITYISVLERKKEIGILRAMGASKRNIANIFNAETFIEGLISGVIAIAVIYIASPIVNPYILRTHNVDHILNLPVHYAVILVLISVGLTLLAGLIPSSAASRRDPVEALRSE